MTNNFQAMLKLFSPAVAILNRLQRRYAQARPGSVLILVVVLVVLLALLGTALLSTTRNDRYTAAQNTSNTQISLLVEAVKTMAQAMVADDLFGIPPGGSSTIYRPPDETAQIGEPDYKHYDSSLGDLFLADRVPQLMTVPTSSGNIAVVGWHGITWPVAASGTRFSGPDRQILELFTDWAAGTSYNKGQLVRYGGGFYVAKTAHVASANDVDTLTGKLKTDPAGPWISVPAKSAFAFAPAVKNGLPALKQFNLSLSPSDPDSPGYLYGNQRQPFYAGDADGDGIADSLLFPLNVSIDGVEYFAAIRIVDNSAAVNINTAFSQHSDRRSLTTPVDAFNQADFANLSAPGAANLGMFRSHVGLLEMLSANSTASNADAEITALLQRRANSTTTYGSAIPVGDPDSGNVGVLRADPGDFQYRTLGDVWEHQLARRLENPGYNTTTIRYSPFTVSDLKSLAYRLTLPNAEGFRCLLEQVFMNATPNDGYDSLSGLYSYPTAPYAPSQVDLWYSHRFNFDRAVGTIFIPQWPGAPYLSGTLSTAGNPLSLRAVLTTHNAVANLAPRHDMQLTGNRQILPENKTPMPVTDPSLLPLMPNHSDPGKIHTPAKTNINTAPFGELWRAFWEVMVDQSTHEGTPFGTSIATSPAAQRENQPLEVYFGNQFVLGTNAPTSPDPQHPQRMFRSSIRDMQPTPTVLFPAHQQLLLRAALAAVNAEDLRDSDLYTVTRRSIHLQMLRGTGATNAKVYVFGTERQPFITEVYACTDPDAVVPGGNPYVAIELYNPYDQPIDISDWTLAVLDRRLPGGAQSNPYPNQLRYFYIHAGAENTTGTPDHTTIPFKFRDATGSPVLVPAGGYLIIQSENGGPHPDHIPTPPGGTNVINVPNLHWVIERSLLKMEWEYRGGELVLLRPAGPVAAGQQRRLELGEWAPVDSFDFTGLMDRERFLEDPLTGQPQQPQSGDPPPEPVYFAWHYRRQNVDPGSTRPNWKFVYPGRYYGTIDERRQQGTRRDWWAVGDGPDTNPQNQEINPNDITLGAPNESATYVTPQTRELHTIQLANIDQPGPHRIVDPVSPNLKPSFPFGGFARNGDILQVPFIGSYVVVVDPSPTVLGDEILQEVNPVTIDSCFAHDTDPQNNEPATPSPAQIYEQVGRFVPITGTGASIGDDLNPDGTYNLSIGSPNKWHYRWAMRLFDYLTVDAPSNDYMANAPPQQEWSANLAYKQGEVVQVTPTGGKPSDAVVYVARTDIPPSATFSGNWVRIGPASGSFRKPVKNSPDQNAAEPGSPDANKEDTVPVHGLINLNTASWKVLATIPWVPAGQTTAFGFSESSGVFTVGSDPQARDDNIDIAKAIVAWRDGLVTPSGYMPGKGPFRSLFDLYRVTDATGKRIFLDIQQAQAAGAEPGDPLGDFSPYDGDRPGPVPSKLDGVRYDFEEQCLLMNRVSNLLTTRSDSFTAYILIQGWRGVGSSRPELVAQRRAAFLVDRSNLTETSNKLNQPVNVPNE